MSETGWIVLAALASIALASMAVRGVAKLRGRELHVYLVAAGLAAFLGGAIAIEIDESYGAVGLAAGLACVELGPTIGAVARKVIRRKGDGL